MVISLRLFIAISLPESWTAALHSASAVLRKHSLHGSFTRRENFHLTLAFLGNLASPAPAQKAMSAVEAAPFILRATAPGASAGRTGTSGGSALPLLRPERTAAGALHPAPGCRSLRGRASVHSPSDAGPAGHCAGQFFSPAAGKRPSLSGGAGRLLLPDAV